MANESILLFQDSESTDAKLLTMLIRCGYALQLANTIDDALMWLMQASYDLVVVTVDGALAACPWCHELRAAVNSPILVLGPFEQTEWVVHALTNGADVYLPVQTPAPIVQAQITALLRPLAQARTEKLLAATTAHVTYRDEQLVIDINRRSVLVHGKPADLTPTEFRLLALLVANAGRIVSYDQILTNVWGWDKGGHNQIHTHVSNLRKKIGDNARTPRYIVGEYGVGYIFLKKG